MVYCVSPSQRSQMLRWEKRFMFPSRNLRGWSLPSAANKMRRLSHPMVLDGWDTVPGKTMPKRATLIVRTETNLLVFNRATWVVKSIRRSLCFTLGALLYGWPPLDPCSYIHTHFWQHYVTRYVHSCYSYRKACIRTSFSGNHGSDRSC